MIAGATKPEQVESNVKAGEWRLSAGRHGRARAAALTTMVRPLSTTKRYA